MKPILEILGLPLLLLGFVYELIASAFNAGRAWAADYLEELAADEES